MFGWIVLTLFLFHAALICVSVKWLVESWQYSDLYLFICMKIMRSLKFGNKKIQPIDVAVQNAMLLNWCQYYLRSLARKRFHPPVYPLVRLEHGDKMAAILETFALLADS